jgi:HSP20 family molecular chaperone IbpA
MRRFTLPDTADPENIKAKSQNGSLEVRIAKREVPTLSRRIPIEK